MIFPALPADPAAQFLQQAVAAVHAGSRTLVEGLFAHPSDGSYLVQMAENRGGLRRLKVAMIPVPPGWPKTGQYWMIFHTQQTIEEDHDPVFLVQAGPGGLRLGVEVPEDDLDGWRIKAQKYSATVTPETSTVQVATTLTLEGHRARALAFRLNDNYSFPSQTVVQADESTIPNPGPGSLVRAGSLLIPWTDHPAKQYSYSYSTMLPKGEEDQITDNSAYVTAWWLPSLGRLPYTVDATITGPARWVIRGEGVPGIASAAGSQQTCHFKCDLPISFPKIIAGDYRLEAARVVDGETFQIFQLEPINKALATTDLDRMVQAATFYQNVLGPLPFKGYECYDADRYYGIESYSHTLLQRNVTHFISHELGHSYFGGLAPCAYVHDTWNEGVTQYIDSVALLNDADHTLEMGLATVGLNVPLSQMAIAWGNNSATYYRGAYVMKMLEAEIGKDKVLKALSLIAHDRIGKDTRWADLRRYFEQTGDKRLEWFWAQWVDGAKFPKLELHPSPTGVEIEQSGTDQPFRLRFAVRYKSEDGWIEKPVEMRQKTLQVTLPVGAAAELKLFPYTLASTS